MPLPPSGFDFFSSALETLRRSREQNDPRRIRRLPAVTVRADMPRPDPMDAPLRALLNLGAPVAQSGLDAATGVAKGITAAGRRLGLNADRVERFGQGTDRASQRIGDVIDERMPARTPVDQMARIVGSAALPVTATVAGGPAAGLAMTGAMSAGNRRQSGTAALADLTGSETLRKLSDKTVMRSAADMAFDRIADVVAPLAVGSIKKVAGAAKSAKDLPKSYDELLNTQAIGEQTLRTVDPETGLNAKGEGRLMNKSSVAMGGEMPKVEQALIDQGVRKSVVPVEETLRRSLGVDVNALVRSGRVSLNADELAALGGTVQSLSDQAEDVLRRLTTEADPVRRDALRTQYDEMFSGLAKAERQLNKAGSEQGRGLNILKMMSRVASKAQSPDWALETARRLGRTDAVDPKVEDAIRKTFRETPLPPKPTPEQEALAAEHRKRRGVINAAKKQAENPLPALTPEQLAAAKARRETQSAITAATKQAESPLTATPEQLALAEQRRAAKEAQAGAPKSAGSTPGDTEYVNANQIRDARKFRAEEARKTALKTLRLGVVPDELETILERSQQFIDDAEKLANMERLSPDEIAELRDRQARAGNPIARLASWIEQSDRGANPAARMQAEGPRQPTPKADDPSLLGLAKDEFERDLYTRGTIDGAEQMGNPRGVQGPKDIRRAAKEYRSVTADQIADAQDVRAIEAQRKALEILGLGQAPADLQATIMRSLDVMDDASRKGTVTPLSADEAAELRRLKNEAVNPLDRLASWIRESRTRSAKMTADEDLAQRIVDGNATMPAAAPRQEGPRLPSLGDRVERLTEDQLARERTSGVFREDIDAAINAVDAFNKALDARAFRLAHDLQDAQKGNALDVLLSQRRSGMMTALTTHLVNITSGIENSLATAGVIHPLAAAFDRVYSTATGKPRTVMLTREGTKARLTGMKEGLGKATNPETFLRGIDPDNPFDALNRDRVNYVNSLNLEAKEGEKAWRKTLRGGVQALQVVNDAVYGMMNLPDQTLFTGSFKSGLAERAVLRAQREGLKRGTDDFASRVAELSNPQGASPDDVLLASQEALRETFKSRTFLGSAVAKAHRSANPVYRAGSQVIAPFATTPVNLATTQLERTPIVGLLRELTIRGDELQRAQKTLSAGVDEKTMTSTTKESLDLERRRRMMLSLAKQGHGAALIGLGAYLYSEGKASGPYQAGQRGDAENDRDLAGIETGMVKVGNEWKSLLPFGPDGMLMNMGAAIAAQIKEDVTESAATKAVNATTVVGRSTYASLKDLPMLQTLSDLDEMFRSGRENAMRGAGELAARVATSFIPASSLLAASGRAIDPVQKRDPQGFVEAAQERLPFLRERVPAKLGPFAETTPNPGGIRTLADPFRTTPGRDSDQTIRWLMDNDVRVPRPAKRKDETREAYLARRKEEGPLEKRVLDEMVRAVQGKPTKDRWAREQSESLLESSDAAWNLHRQGKTGDALELLLRNYRAGLAKERKERTTTPPQGTR